MTDKEINEAVARKLGWAHYPKGDIHIGDRVVDVSWRRGEELKRHHPDTMFIHGFRYCLDIRAAWEIIKAHDFQVELTRHGSGKEWSCILRSGHWPEIHDSKGRDMKAAKAICLAFIGASK